MKKLLVIISDRLSNLVYKGEITENYYNPKNYFDEVHIIMTNDDSVDQKSVQKTVGTAKLKIYNVPTSKYFLISTLGWRPFLLNQWSKKGVALAENIQPDIIRCYGNRLSGYLAYKIKKEMSIPYVLSMHEDPDNVVKSENNVFRTIQYAMLEGMGKMSIQNADLVIAVYDSIVKYLKRMDVAKYKIIHNAVNGKYINVKENYDVGNDFNIISVGRLVTIKNPVNLIRAVAEIDNCNLTVIGDGTEYGRLVELVRSIGASNKIKFIKAMDNDKVCSILKEYDCFSIHCDVTGVPKTVIEAWLTGMPIITNHPAKGETTEYINEQNIILVEDSVEGYKNRIIEVMRDKELRIKLGTTARKMAELDFLPHEMEQQVVEIYEEILK